MNTIKTTTRMLSMFLALGLTVSAAAQTGKSQPATSGQKASQPKTGTAPAPARSGQSESGIPANWDKVPIPALHQFKPQEPRRVEFPNGLVVFFQEDHELPVINGFIRIRGGSRDEPAAKVGMISIYGEVWRIGGTTSKTGD